MNDAAKHKPLRIGLTGGIASGKTLVSDLFAERGVPIIDTDVIAREVVAPGSPGLAEIRELFGNEIVDSDGLLDRKLLRQVVFGDDEQRRKLEEITHPRIRDAAIAQAEAVQHPYLIMVVPLLVESPMKALMDRILVVDCTEQTQLTRLLARDAEDEAQARRIIASQASREQRLKIADDVVQNDGTPLDVQAAVEVLHQQYLALSSQKRP